MTGLQIIFAVMGLVVAPAVIGAATAHAAYLRRRARHAHCLANIERLELELGMRKRPSNYSAARFTAAAAAERWIQGVSAGSVARWKS